MMKYGKAGKCTFGDRDFLLFHYREMTSDRMTELEAHLAACSECRKSLDRLTRSLALLTAEPAGISEADLMKFTSRVMTRVCQRASFHMVIWKGALAAAMIIMTLGVFQQWGIPEHPAPPGSFQPSAEEVIGRMEFLQTMELLEDLEIIFELAASE